MPVLDRKGHIRHDGGVVASPGMYLMGMPFLRRRKSSLIDGAGDDARDLTAHLASYLDGHRANSDKSAGPHGRRHASLRPVDLQIEIGFLERDNVRQSDLKVGDPVAVSVS